MFLRQHPKIYDHLAFCNIYHAFFSQPVAEQDGLPVLTAYGVAGQVGPLSPGLVVSELISRI